MIPRENLKYRRLNSVYRLVAPCSLDPLTLEHQSLLAQQ